MRACSDNTAQKLAEINASLDRDQTRRMSASYMRREEIGG